MFPKLVSSYIPGASVGSKWKHSKPIHGIWVTCERNSECFKDIKRCQRDRFPHLNTQNTLRHSTSTLSSPPNQRCQARRPRGASRSSRGRLALRRTADDSSGAMRNNVQRMYKPLKSRWVMDCKIHRCNLMQRSSCNTTLWEVNLKCQDTYCMYSNVYFMYVYCILVLSTTHLLTTKRSGRPKVWPLHSKK